MRYGGTVTDKADFLAFIPEIREKAFKRDTIIHAFRDRGIYPWDPEIVLAPLREKAPLCPELQFISGDPASEVVESHEKFIGSLRNLVDEHIRKTELLQATEVELLRKRVVLSKLSTNRSRKQLSHDGVWRGKDAKRCMFARERKEADAAAQKASKNAPVLGDT